MSALACCRGLPKSLRDYFDPTEGELTLEQVQERMQPQITSWRSNAQLNEGFWTMWAGIEQVANPVHAHLLSWFKQEGVMKGTMVDLGCGNGDGGTLRFLAAGWDVIAVDSNQAALDILIKRAKEVKSRFEQLRRVSPDAQMKMGKLETVHSTIESYAFPRRKVEMVLAIDSLNYCNPSEMLRIWNRAHSALKSGGRIACSLPRAPILPFGMIVSNMVAPSWYTDPIVFHALVRGKGYQEEYFGYSGRRMFSVAMMLAIGKKA